MLCESIWEGRISQPTVINVLLVKAGEAPDVSWKGGEDCVVGEQGKGDKHLSRMIEITEQGLETGDGTGNLVFNKVSGKNALTLESTIQVRPIFFFLCLKLYQKV